MIRKHKDASSFPRTRKHAAHRRKALIRAERSASKAHSSWAFSPDPADRRGLGFGIAWLVEIFVIVGVALVLL